mmetsp:Transcript_34366/g.61689  ORF Transcript_34366/g.61689 Transcript_34366/m.61689 type:complete len:84 (+) Transcript_34366:153-404(+)
MQYQLQNDPRMQQIQECAQLRPSKACIPFFYLFHEHDTTITNVILLDFATVIALAQNENVKLSTSSGNPNTPSKPLLSPSNVN